MPYALYERRGKIGVVTLNRPERLNAISHTLTADFEAALASGFADDAALAIILTGAGRAFCSGEDLKEAVRTESEEAIRGHIASTQRITRLMLGSSKPVIGAMHGYAVGGGFEWLLNCDLVVASETLVAFFPEMSLGHFLTGGVTHLLPQAVGYQRSMELFLLGDRQRAERLERLGLVNMVVPQEEMMPKAFEVAERVAANSPFAMGKLKMALNQQLGAGLWKAVDLEEDLTVAAFNDPFTLAKSKSFNNARN
jgi:enoyl-CoA hydratase/carnithine racemase